MTQSQFEQLNNQRRAEMSPPRHAVTFPLTKRKVVKKRTERHYLKPNGVPAIEVLTPTETREVADTGSITKLYQAMWSMWLGTDLKRISSEGSWRPGIGFIPSANRGIADLMGGHNGKVYYIEVKQKSERLLPTQIKFKAWVESFGGEYYIIHNFNEMYELICNIQNK